jgi:hypothetical protein
MPACRIKVREKRDKRDKSPYHVPACRCFADREHVCSEISRGGLVSYMDRPVPPSGVAVSIFHLVRPAANGTITLPTCQGERSSRLPPSVSSGLGWRQASVRWCSRSCQNCSIKRTHWAHPVYTVISALRRRALVGRRYVADRRDPSLLMSH